MTDLDTQYILGHGFVRYIEHLGSDLRIVQAARVSYMSKSKGEEADKKLLEYLFKNRHTSPFEQCNVSLNIKMPIFIMRQFVRHRTFRLNEMSARYTELPEDFFIPMGWRTQDTLNKQGSLTQDSAIFNAVQSNRAKSAYDHSMQIYKLMIADGVAKEMARIVLPVGIFTEIVVNCDLHNLMHFLYLRTHKHAQIEMQELAWAMYRIAGQLFPWTMNLFDKYRPMMMEVLKLAPE